MNDGVSYILNGDYRNLFKFFEPDTFEPLTKFQTASPFR